MSGIGPISNPLPLDLFVGPLDPEQANTPMAADNANSAYLYAFQVHSPLSVSKAYIQAGTQSGNLDLGIYSSVISAGNIVCTRVASTGSTAWPAGGAGIAFTAPVTLVPGVRYYAAVAADNTTGQLRGNSTFGAMLSVAIGPSQITGARQATSFPLPAGPFNLTWISISLHFCVLFG